MGIASLYPSYVQFFVRTFILTCFLNYFFAMRSALCALRLFIPDKHTTRIAFFIRGKGGEGVLFVFGGTLGHDGCRLELPIPAINPL